VSDTKKSQVTFGSVINTSKPIDVFVDYFWIINQLNERFGLNDEKYTKALKILDKEQRTKIM
jgi:hypothetical protein